MTIKDSHRNNRATGTDAASYLYNYFVSFHHNTGGGINFTNAEITLTFPVSSWEQIEFLQTHYRSKGYTNALIMGCTLMRRDRADRHGRPS